MNFTRTVLLALLVTIVGPFGSTRAAEEPAENCPAVMPEGSQERRAVAKDWFSRAEAAETSGNEPLAIKAYACSLSAVPHAFTAYNLARVAHKAGDLEMALQGYQAYVKLSPEAKDREKVQAQIEDISARVASVRDEQAALEHVARADAAPKAEVKLAEVIPEVPRPRERPPQTTNTAVGPSNTALWIVGAAGAVTLVVGILLNVAAHSKMANCRTQADTNQVAAARASCDSAKAAAYTSYGLLAASGLTLAIDAAILLHRPSTAISQVALRTTPGGATVSALFRF